MATQTISYLLQTNNSFTNAECVSAMYTTNANTNISTITSTSGCIQASDGSLEVRITRFDIDNGTCNADSGTTVLSPIILTFSSFPLVIGESHNTTVNLTNTGTCPGTMQVTFTATALSTLDIQLQATFNNDISGTVTFQAINPGDNFTYNIIDCTQI